MATAIQMPKLSDTMTEGTIQKWLVKEGDKVRAGDPIAEVETDKATLEMEAYDAGTILKILSGDGTSAAVGAVIAVVGKPGEDWQSVAGGAAAGGAAPQPAPVAEPAAPAAGTAVAAAGGGSGGKATAVQMPKLSDTMTEGTIQKWLVKEGDKVRAGDPIAEVETDKATLEMEAYDAGTVLKILSGDGSSAPVGGVIAVIGEPGADWQAAAGGAAPAAAAAAPAPAPAGDAAKGEKVVWKPSKPAERAVPPSEAHVAVQQHPQVGAPSYQKGMIPGEIPGVTFGWGHSLAPAVPKAGASAAGGKVRASPVARKMAAEMGVDLATVQGSGPAGRVTRDDVLQASRAPAPAAAAAPTAAAAAPAAAAQAETQPLSQMRKAIARNLQQAKRDIPHFYLTMDVDMGKAVEFRAQAKAMEIKFSINDLILKAVAIAAKQHPRVQAQLVDEGTISVPTAVNLGVAVALEDGLITPVLRNAESMSLGEMNRQVRDLAAKARDKKLKPDEYQGGTITVSNLGMFDIEHFYAIVNPPQASIVSVGKVREEPVVVDGQIVVGQRMRIGYSGDHRIVDGAVGAQFLQSVKVALENPMKMLVG